jgi:lipopolysaccharide/colanic/teichoic acid biosynthesis glycosyltransferase
VSLAAKRALDLVLALAMISALTPFVLLAAALLLTDDERWIEHRVRLGRDGRALRLWRFRPLPGRLGRALERIGVRELPLLALVVAGRLSFVGPRALPLESDGGYAGPRQLMTPGLIGPAQRWATGPDSASELDDAYVEAWSLIGDLRLLTYGHRRRPLAVRR